VYRRQSWDRFRSPVKLCFYVTDMDIGCVVLQQKT